MSFAKKIIVAVSPEENIETLLSPIKEMIFTDSTEIHFVNVFSVVSYSVWATSAPLIFPLEDDRQKIEDETNKKLQELSKHLLPSSFKGKVVVKCLFGEHVKDTFSNYVNKESADLVIVAKREKRGIFESSFASFVNNHTKANLLLLKK
jgi:nucleotide-binding universal stress UspA family protein